MGGERGFRKFRFLIKYCLGGQVSSFETPYVSYLRPLAAIKTKKHGNKKYPTTDFGNMPFIFL